MPKCNRFVLMWMLAAATGFVVSQEPKDVPVRRPGVDSPVASKPKKDRLGTRRAGVRIEARVVQPEPPPFRPFPGCLESGCLTRVRVEIAMPATPSNPVMERSASPVSSAFAAYTAVGTSIKSSTPEIVVREPGGGAAESSTGSDSRMSAALIEADATFKPFPNCPALGCLSQSGASITINGGIRIQLVLPTKMGRETEVDSVASQTPGLGSAHVRDLSLRTWETDVRTESSDWQPQVRAACNSCRIGH